MMLGGTELLVLVATRPVDFRKQADTLAAFVQQALLMTKRLEGSAFRWPPVEDGVMRLSPAQLAALLEGTEWARAGTREVERPRAAS